MQASPVIVFRHGAWVTPRCWDPFAAFFAAHGYRCVAPAWPGKDRPIEAIRRDQSALLGVGIAEIVEHHERILRALDEPPILIGHSLGGLVVQILLDRGFGSAAVAVGSAPPRGVAAFAPTAFRALVPVLGTWRGWRKVVRLSYQDFRWAFAHNMSGADQRSPYDTQITPESGRIFFQAALAGFDRHSPAAVDFGNGLRAPLLLIGGTKDRIVPASVSQRNFRALLSIV